MNFTSVPIIVISCYVIGEIYKFIFRNKDETYKFIPVLSAAVGGALGILIFYTAPEMIFDADNVWTALSVGLVSGLSATGTNQIVKQFFTKDKENKKKDKDNVDTKDEL